MASTATAKAPTLPKDDIELELEKLVFGDQEGFRRELKTFDEDSDTQRPSRSHGFELKARPDSSVEERDLTALDDAELFFFDSGSGPARQQQGSVLVGDAEHEAEEYDPPAWVDSDDERVVVSLASTNRLRKLRRTENEDYVNGVEYTRRLCQQFEQLYPPPEWAVTLRTKQSDTHRKKRRRLSGSSSSSSEEAQSDNEEMDPESISTQPLAELLQSTAPLVKKSVGKLNGRVSFRPEVLDIQRTKDVSGGHPSSVLSLSFHPTLPLLLSSGPSGLVTLHHIAPAAPTPNPVLTRVALRRLPLQTAAFHPNGARVILAAPRRYYHVWDLDAGRFQRVAGSAGPDDTLTNCSHFALSPCGRYIAFVGAGRKGGGSVNIADAETGQWICTGRVEGRGGVADLAWWRTGDGLCILGKGGEVLEYSVRERRPLARWTDDGAVGATVIALGGTAKQNTSLGGDRFVATGSAAGIVNLYDRSTWSVKGDTTDIPERPTPQRTLDQLVTSISLLQFSPDGQLLAMASQAKRDALRLVHLPSCTVYRNWPTRDTPLGRVTSLAWGRMNDEGELVMAVANEQGKIRLWLLRG